MQAWRFTTPTDGLQLVNTERPTAGPGEVIVEVAAAGLCHTDVGILHGLQPPVTPITLGHEISGRIAETGPEVDGWKSGDRVAVVPGLDAPGTASDGGYASHVRVSVRHLVAVPDGVDDAAAAVATDAGLTAYRAVMTAGRVQAGMNVGVMGLGGVGMIGARLAALTGATVYAAEPKQELYPIAAAQGVASCASTLDSFAGHELDVVIDFAGMNTTADAFRAVRPRGRIIQIGIGRPEATIDLFTVLTKEAEYLGSTVGTPDELTQLLALIDDGQVIPTIEPIAFPDIGSGLARLAAGQVTGRLVAVL